jgi:subtilisin family serine protease
MQRLGRILAVVTLLVMAWGGVAFVSAQAPTVRYAVVLEAERDTVQLLPAAKRWGLAVAFREGAVLAFTGRPGLLDSLRALRPAPLYAEYDATTPLPPPDSTALADLSDLAAPMALPWNLAMIGADSAWNRGITGAGVRVGIMDSGIFADHPHLNVVGGRNFGTSNGGPEAWGDTFAPCKGHGSHVAGSVGSSVNGAAPGVELFALRVFEDINGECLSWSSVQAVALRWADSVSLPVVNASIGGGATGVMMLAVQGYTARGGMLVASSGNAGGATAYYPAAYAGVLSVGAVTSGGGRASYSNRDPDLDLVAPGSGIVSSLPSGGTGSKSGTSMASPHVAGVVALLRGLRPELTPDSITALLHASAVDGGPVGPDPEYGRGRVDVPRLLALVIPRAPMIAPPDPTPLGVTRCVPVASASPWTATTDGTLAVWQSGSSLCWRGDAAGTFTIRLRST